jgi:hypothetical protein
MVGMVAGVRGGHVASLGTPAISHPWEIATRTKSALGILPPPISVTPLRGNMPAPNAGGDIGVRRSNVIASGSNVMAGGSNVIASGSNVIASNSNVIASRSHVILSLSKDEPVSVRSNS